MLVRASHSPLRTRPRGAACIRHSLRPLFQRGGNFLHNPGRNTPRECEAVFSIGRHCEERSDEAIHLALCRGLDCFAEPVIGRAFVRPLARNDVLNIGPPTQPSSPGLTKRCPALPPQRSGFFSSEKRSGSRPSDGCSLGASTVRTAERSLMPGSLVASRCEVAPRQRSSTAATKCMSWPAATDGAVESVASLRGN